MTLTGVPRERPQVASKPLYLKWQTQTSNIIYIMRNAVMARLARFVGSGWRWLKLWIGSCFPSRTPNKDEIAA